VARLLRRSTAVKSRSSASFLFLIGYFLIVILVTVRVYLGEFEGFRGDYFKLSAALIADHDVAFFYFVGIEIEHAFAFLTNGHNSSPFMEQNDVDGDCNT
jgi:hypothetical protein